ncbi:heterokaryon incompatibility protein-domain-containing protein [Xylaria bambusicola]|uniref:heterokaryon incompatibility protein-domain-containing protein n=1 Tax=Xylaria bambusicola TaxID=326684 RepID=UPI00200808E7|nr:heterokaryon incompatibility protein-domain-containing protein [Xylaria bambusicola]KAI0505324.1 heterokaryon incompatibility protein-domain-containing protein [Xylaria bambusicola]
MMAIITEQHKECSTYAITLPKAISPQSIGLPKLGPRAQAKLDRLTFREPGDESAKKRKKERLEKELSQLKAEEDDSKEKLDEMRNRYLPRTEVEEVELFLISINMKVKDMNDETQKLCNDVGKQVDETKRALVQALAPRLVVDPQNVRASRNLKKKKEKLIKLQRDYDISKLRLMICDYEILDLETKITRAGRREEQLEELIGSPTDKHAFNFSSDSSKGASESDHPLTRKMQTQTVDITAEDGSMESTADENIENTEKPENLNTKAIGPVAVAETINRVNADASSNSDNPSEVTPHTNIGENPETQKEAQKEANQRAKDLRQKQQRMKRKADKHENRPSKVKEARKRCIKDHDSNKERLTKLEEEIKSLNVSNEKDKGGLDVEGETDRIWQAKKYKDHILDVEDLVRQKNREKSLEKLRKGYINSSRTVRIRLNLSAWISYSDIWESDSEEESEDKHLQSLRKVLDEVEAIEEKIRNIRRLNEKVDNVADKRIVLERELDLETKWLATRDKAAASVEREDPVVQEVRDHFSSSTPSGFYKPLEEGQIRLLVVWPAPADHYPLLCTLETSTFGEAPKYAALSYNWGSDLCNGRLYLVKDNAARNTEKDSWGLTARYAVRIPIRNNLFRALLRLRRSDHAISIWVDVMCINQADVTEKTKQLEQLVNIYRKAENENRSTAAMEFIPAIMGFAVLDRYAQDPSQAEKWYGLAELMRDRWFSRRWATIHCGGKETIKKLFNYSKWRDGPNTLGDIHSFGACILLEATSKLFLRTAQGEITSPIKKLESLDLIYILVSIASDTPQAREIYANKQHEVVPLVVDYAKPPLRVYKDFVKFCIMSSKSLDVLCRPWAMPPRRSVATENEAIDLPSWIPLLSRGRKNGENLVGAVDRPNYKACAEAKYNAQLSNEPLEDLKFLLVDGFKLARIGKVSSRIAGGVIHRDSLTMGGVPDAIWRTLVADRDQDGQIPPTWYQRACMRCLEIADTFNNGNLNIGELLKGKSELIRKYLIRVRSVTWNRRFFAASTENESHSMITTQTPNEEAMHEGGQTFTEATTASGHHTDGRTELFRVPVILRQEGGCMRLIGETYVHGKMEGEAMEDLERRNIYGEKVTFKLK